MDCDFNNPQHTCPFCGTVAPGPDYRMNCYGALVTSSQLSTGSILHKLLNDHGLTELPGCSCKSIINWMNRIGPQGCREQKEIIVKKLNESRELVSWSTMIRAGVAAVKSGLAFKLNPLDPIGSLVDEAIRLAELEGK